MRIVFMGTPEFAVPSLKALIREGYEIAGVFTQPDRPKGRGKKPAPGPVKIAAEEAGIPVFQPERIRKTGVEDLRNLKPDLCVTAAFGQILSQEILDIPPLGNINVHASLLPRHRGAAPIAHAIMDGDEKAGVTTMFMDAGIDTGIRTIKEIEAGTLVRYSQNEAEMTYDPMLEKGMGIIDFSMKADAIRGRINGLNPWPCVTVPMQGDRLKLLRAVTCDGSGEPGNVLSADPKSGLRIACGSGAVRILELQAPGGKRMKAEDWLRGHGIPAGTCLREDA